MPSARYHSSRPTESVLPRAHRDASQRFQTYGPIEPMDAETDFTAWGFVKGVSACLLLLIVVWVAIGAFSSSSRDREKPNKPSRIVR